MKFFIGGVEIPWDATRINREFMRAFAKGLRPAAIFLKNRVKEILSVPAPRVRLQDRHGAPYYVAGWEKNRPGKTNKVWTGGRWVVDKKTGKRTFRTVSYEPSFAIPGNPPRKLSGRLRASIDYEITDDGIRARVGTNVIYARRHELGGHPFLRRTLEQFADEIESIITGGMKGY